AVGGALLAGSPVGTAVASRAAVAGAGGTIIRCPPLLGCGGGGGSLVAAVCRAAAACLGAGCACAGRGAAGCREILRIGHGAFRVVLNAWQGTAPLAALLRKPGQSLARTVHIRDFSEDTME